MSDQNQKIDLLGKAQEGFMLGACRHGICFVPIILILTALWGINGIIYSQLGVDMLLAIITVFLACAFING